MSMSRYWCNLDVRDIKKNYLIPGYITSGIHRLDGQAILPFPA